jgi:hypothetical protein
METSNSIFPIDNNRSTRTATLEDFLFPGLLPALMPDDNYFNEAVHTMGLPIIDPVAHILHTVDQDGTIPYDRRRRAVRNKRRKRDPYSSIFFTKYLQEADESAMLEDKQGTIRDPTSVEGLTFRRRFGIPFSVFETISQDWSDHGEYRKAQDAVGRERTDSRILLLGCFRVLAKGVTFDAIEELSNVSVPHNHSFFKKFIGWFYQFYFTDWIHFPSIPQEVQHVESMYAKVGVPGCIGSIDCVHIGWDMCPAGYQADCIGKEGYPTLAFEVIVSHTRKILAVTQSFFGTWNDKTIVRYDDKVTNLRSIPFYSNYKWYLQDSTGNLCEHKGLYLICDGGYHRWSTLIPPYKHQ